ncbi:MAG: hypothetical protein ACOC3T_01390, partial [Bacteroidota bacterium]
MKTKHIKKIIVSLSLLFALANSGNAQFMNSSRVLEKSYFSLALEPVYLVESSDIMLNVYGALGLDSKIDLGIRYGINGGDYFGAQVEWGLSKNFCLFTGVHYHQQFALDGALAVNIPVTSTSHIFLGADADVVIGNNIVVPLWLPVGVEIALSS